MKPSRILRCSKQSLNCMAPANLRIRAFLALESNRPEQPRACRGFGLLRQGQSESSSRSVATHVARALHAEDALCEGGDCLPEEDGSVLVRDDLDALLLVLPPDIREPLVNHPDRARLLEVILDLGRRPEARFLGREGGEYLRDAEITWDDLKAAEQALGEFGGDNRAGVQGTLHRISAMRNRKGTVIGLTCRVGRAVTGHIDMIRDVLDTPNSILFLGKPGVGKTTVIREMARVLSDELHKRVVIVDTSNEIGGDGDVPHPAIGGARRMQVPDPSQQHRIMVEAVENHMPEIVIVDEIGTEAEALACRTIAERGVQLVATAHGQLLENLIKNPTLSDLVGGVASVTLGDEEARLRGTQKSILERKAPPTFPLVMEMRDRSFWVVHWVEDSVDALLQTKVPLVQVRRRDKGTRQVKVEQMRYDAVTELIALESPQNAELPSRLHVSPVFDTSPGFAGNILASSGSGFGNSLDSERSNSWSSERMSEAGDRDMLDDLQRLGYGGEYSGRNRERADKGRSSKSSRRVSSKTWSKNPRGY